MQRVTEASVTVDGRGVGAIGPGLLVLIGVARTDDSSSADRLAAKVAKLRVFADAAGRFNRSLVDLGTAGAALCVSQFTLYADLRKGTRPSFGEAADPQPARALYERFCDSLAASGPRVERGEFGAHMRVALVNDGPVSLLVEV